VKFIHLLFVLALPAFAQEADPPDCQILSMQGTRALYMKPASAGVLTIKSGTIIALKEKDGETKVCRLNHWIYPFVEESGEAFDLRNGQTVFKSGGEKFSVPLPLASEAAQ
jgi:hypothetical protein